MNDVVYISQPSLSPIAFWCSMQLLHRCFMHLPRLVVQVSFSVIFFFNFRFEYLFLLFFLSSQCTSFYLCSLPLSNSPNAWEIAGDTGHFLFIAGSFFLDINTVTTTTRLGTWSCAWVMTGLRTWNSTRGITWCVAWIKTRNRAG